jgi:hypothetical protein
MSFGGFLLPAFGGRSFPREGRKGREGVWGEDGGNSFADPYCFCGEVANSKQGTGVLGGFVPYDFLFSWLTSVKCSGMFNLWDVRLVSLLKTIL